MTAYQPAAYSSPAERPRTGLRIALAAILAVALLAGAFLAGKAAGGTSSAPTAPTGSALASPYGPKEFTDGIPHGYTHDKGGAAAAALNILVAAGLCTAGQIDAAKAIATLAADSPAPIVSSLLHGQASPGNVTPSLTRPLAVLSVDAGSDTATVKVWAAHVDGPSVSPKAAPSVTLQTSYLTATISLKWQHDDWKFADVASTEAGPDPTRTPATTAFGWIGNQWVLYTGGN